MTIGIGPLSGAPLGAGAAPGFVTLARVSAPGPLGVPALVVRHDFTGLLGDAVTRFVMDLITPAGTVRVPMSSWQATLQTGSSDYVQCVIPACAPWVSTIISATSFVIYRQAGIPGAALPLEYEMARSNADNAQFDQGPQRYTCTLSGYPPGAPAVVGPPSAVFDRTLTGVRSISMGSGLRVRCAVDWLLRPGQRAFVRGSPFVARYINYYINPGDAYMEVGE